MNAFEFNNDKKAEQYVRWQFVPEAGEKMISDAELKKNGGDYLETELPQRLRKAPATWSMIATLAEKDDALVDPSTQWTGPHKTVKMGTLKISSTMAQEGGPCNKINYDPTHVSDGVEISDEPVLKFRSPAYAVSYGKRLSDPADPAPPAERKARSRRACLKQRD